MIAILHYCVTIETETPPSLAQAREIILNLPYDPSNLEWETTEVYKNQADLDHGNEWFLLP